MVQIHSWEVDLSVTLRKDILTVCFSLVLDVCVYHGKVYKQGQKWQDGCDYDCECINSMEGKYKCVEK